MATFRRSLVQGGTYFFTVNTYQRQALLAEPQVYGALKQNVLSVMRDYPFTIEAFVVLPDHLHCIWTLPEGDAAYSLRWNIIKRRVSQQLRELIERNVSASRSKRRELGLSQRRFWEHQIRNEDDFEQHVNYIHRNPVKHGYVKTVADWPYSSFHRFVSRGVYPVHWAGQAASEREGDYGEPV